MQKILPLIVAGLIFFFMALVHLYRLIHPFKVVIGPYEAPLWVSAIAFIILGLLSLWMFYALRSD